MAEEGLISSSDKFFAAEPHLVAVFEIDYDLVVNFKVKCQVFRACIMLIFVFLWYVTQNASIGAVSFCILFYILLSVLPALVPLYFAVKNVHWSVRAQHVALTQDGVKFVVEKHPTKCGCSCTDEGKVTKTVPYDMITDCDIEEPAGTAVGPFIKNVITKVVIDTASSRQPEHELVLEGLKEPEQFKKMVWDMKAGRHQGVAAGVPTVVTKKTVQASKSQNASTVLLQKIYDEVRELSAKLQSGQ